MDSKEQILDTSRRQIEPAVPLRRPMAGRRTTRKKKHATQPTTTNKTRQAVAQVINLATKLPAHFTLQVKLGLSRCSNTLAGSATYFISTCS